MPVETDRQLTGSGLILLREYIEVRLNLLIVATDKLEASIDRRFCDVDTAADFVAKAIDVRFKHLEQIVALGQENAKRAVDKAELQQSAHNVASNEWRGTLNDFKTTLVGRAEFDKLYSEFAANKLEVSKIMAAQSGKTSVVDPQMHELLSEVRRLAAANATGSGVKEGISSATGTVIIVVTIALTALGTFFSTRNNSAPSAPPVVVAVPAVPITPPQAAPR